MIDGATLRWGAWYSEKELSLTFPKGWKVKAFNPSGGKDIGKEGLLKAFAKPFGMPPISQIAKGKRDAVIVVDDLTRPTPAYRLMPLIIEELLKGGIKEEAIRIILGIAAHHPMNREDAIKKLGKPIVERFWVQNHNVFENLEYLGKTRFGTPVYLNKEFIRADVKICVGSILPHGLSGFGGGAKLVLPGVAGIESLYQNHRGDNGYSRGVNMLDGNVTREDMEEAAAIVGLSAIVNVVLNPRSGIVGCFVGHFIEAHRAGCELARKVYETPVPKGWDVAVLSAYPKDSEFYQSANVFNLIGSAKEPIVHEGGTLVIASAASEGMGVHFLMGPGMRLSAQRQAAQRSASQNTHQLLFSPNISQHDVENWGSDGQSLCHRWQEVIHRLKERQGKEARVAVFPCAAMQLAGEIV